jgi:hypothetical protein
VISGVPWAGAFASGKPSETITSANKRVRSRDLMAK